MKVRIILIVLSLPMLVGFSLNHVTDSNENPSPGWLIANTFYPEHLAGAFTGGFNEPSCHSCHFDYDLNKSEGNLSITGIESIITPSLKIQINVSVTRPDLGKAGFQITSRYDDGTQAGHFQLNENVSLTPNTPGDIAYLQHAVGNVEPSVSKKTWSFIWTAPDTIKSDSIIFNIAANAANGDASEFGDWIYVQEIEVKTER
jgi:hypothetical protein